MRRLLPAALVAAALVLVAPAPDARAAATRIAGADRYETSAAISRSRIQPGVDIVYVANGEGFADALTGSALAGTRRTSVLLVERDAIPPSIRTELERLQPDRIAVLGGTSAVSDEVVAELDELTAGTVTRLAGRDRFSTATQVSGSYFSQDVSYVYIANGEQFPDALSAGAAGVDRGPVLLATKDSIPAATKAELTRLRPQEIVIVGGFAAISDTVEGELGDYTTGPVSRQAGNDRFATSAIVSSGAFQAPTGDVYLTSGRGFADALSGGAIAGANDGPILLTERTCVPSTVKAEIDRLDPDRIVLLGGTGAVSDAVGELRVCGAPVETEVIATGLDTPWDVAFAPDGTAYVTERRGRILRFGADGGTPTVVQTIADAQEQGEGGLLGLEIDGAGRLYAYYTTATDNRVARFMPGQAPQTILTGLKKASNHDAGRLRFGPDGFLYIGVGDAGDTSTPQDPDSRNGKILRVAADGTALTIHALGLRDPQGLAFDDGGRLYSSEFGPDRDDEINTIVAGGNYGWPAVTGDANDARFIDPIVVRQPPVASWSGIEVANGDLYVAALRGQRLYRFDLDGRGGVIGTGEELFNGTYGRLRHVEQAPDGSLWILTSNCDGRGTCGADGDVIIRTAPR
jgi:glucose/arabinose dehydrogenase/putative cell wall-binding protein